MPVCLPSDEHVDYDQMRALTTGFKSNSRGAYNQHNLTRTQTAMTMRGDRVCTKRLQTFDSKLSLCSFDESQFLADESQSVSYLKISKSLHSIILNLWPFRVIWDRRWSFETKKTIAGTRSELPRRLTPPYRVSSLFAYRTLSTGFVTQSQIINLF